MAAMRTSTSALASTSRSSAGRAASARGVRATVMSRRSVQVRAMSEGGHSDYHFTADTIAWNAKHARVLKERIAQLRAAEYVAESMESRPELPSIANKTLAEVEGDAALLGDWHEAQWAKLKQQTYGCGPEDFDRLL